MPTSHFHYVYILWDDALATLFQALYKEVSYNAAAQELNIVKYSA